VRAVILAGGSGTRLWPLSRERFPKQFLPLLGQHSLLQDTIARVRPVVGDEVWVVTTDELRFLAAQQLREIGLDPAGRVLCEPAGRNTAPAIGLAALLSAPEDVLLVLPSDHAVRDEQIFRDALLASRPAAEAGLLVTFGISPSRPETGYGYIQVGRPLPGLRGVCSVDRFVEKPDRARAQQYLSAGGYVWNSGMFAFRAGTLLEEMARHAPDVHRGLEALRPALSQGRDPPADLYRALPKIAIDYAVMERSDKVAVVPVDPGWSDLGSFETLLEILPADADGNVTRLAPGGDAILVESSRNLVWGGKKVVALAGVRDLVVVDTPDALLVCSRERAQGVREVVARLKAAGREEAALHRTVYRPWGSYTVLEEGKGYKVKRIAVLPRARLSLQFHRHRSEHWIGAAGTAGVTRGRESFPLRPNEAAFIPVSVPHRLENPGTEAVEIIEVQIGDYLGEDDIVRLDDDYGRSP